ncbi:MAG: mechanosensitive ion channel family protein [Gammaproteobacteria bacterium]|nr:mechanosensitive ion channel family protein [Gammaproteobacteria bacterium]MCY4281952.1 mechanosensitive ion channel family protein [Gammaproteobacteria bacterium]MCY4338220.1 mechanosensitive ion channel family protein [Gammaproteobacteria bacterium]
MNVDYFVDIWHYLLHEAWILQVFLLVFIALLLDWFQKRTIARLMIQAGKTRIAWDSALLEAAGKPLTVLIWLLGITLAADIAKGETGAVIFKVVAPVREVGVIALIAWFLVRFVKRAELHFIRLRQEAGAPVDRTTTDAIAKLIRISILITAFLVILQALGYSISGVLAFGGVSGIIAGLAAKDLLANFFGGLMIYLDRPFEVGDWIRSPDKEIEGTVEEIGWRLTRIRTFDKRPLYVPNSVFASIAVENPQRMTNRRIYETIGIRYDDAGSMAAITRDVKQMLREHPEIDTNQTMIVNFVKFAPSSLDFFIYTFTKTTQWVRFHEIKEDVMLKVIAIIEQHGAECAFPTSTIHIAPEADVKPDAEQRP